MSLFAPATRHQLRARIAFDGPTGSGKTWSMLAWARALAGPEGRIAVVDTERGSASLYSDRFAFDVLTWAPPYDPRKLAEVLRSAEDEGYDVICVDSLTHFWKGEGGTLDIVEAAGSRSGGNKFSGWSTGTPALRTLIDTMLGLDAHFLGTMRSKMEHVLMENSRGKLEPTKVGMQPEMRADIEYEFTLCVSMDLDHKGTVTKSRCEDLADALIPAGVTHLEDAASRFLGWLRDGAPEPEPLSDETRGLLRAYLNDQVTGEQRYQVRQLWPVGVPELNDPALQERHLDRILRVIEHVTGDTGILPDPVAQDGLVDDLPSDPEFDVDEPTDGPVDEPPADDPGEDEDTTEPEDPAPVAQDAPEDPPTDDQASEPAGEPESATQPVTREAVIEGVQAMTPGAVKAALTKSRLKITGNAATQAARLAAARLVQAGLATDSETEIVSRGAILPAEGDA